MNVRYTEWARLKWFPFVEERLMVAHLSTGPIYDAWTQYRLVYPWR